MNRKISQPNSIAELSGLVPDGASDDYRQAEQFLMRLVNYETQPPPAHRDDEGWHLDAFTKRLAALGHPERACPILHLAGTKGKGSSTMLLVALLKQMGYKRVGSFTSPHMRYFRERISINAQAMSERDFVSVLNGLRESFSDRGTQGMRTTFELLTAMAFVWFKAQKCQAVVLETGLGGRLDCTNVAPSRVALITAIGFDHQKILGRTLAEITREKAGIIKAETSTVVLAPQLPRRQKTVQRVVFQQAQKSSAELLLCSETNNPIQDARPDTEGWELELKWNEQQINGLRFPVFGHHQLNNLHGALAAAEAFGKVDGRTIKTSGLKRALLDYQSPGRLERADTQQVVLLDAAHCGMSARAAIESISEHFPDRQILLVLGLLGDKNQRRILQGFARGGKVDRLFTYSAPSPRGCSGKALADQAKSIFKNVTAYDTLVKSLEAAFGLQKKHQQNILLVSGTTYSISQARDWFSAQ